MPRVCCRNRRRALPPPRPASPGAPPPAPPRRRFARIKRWAEFLAAGGERILLRIASVLLRRLLRAPPCAGEADAHHRDADAAVLVLEEGLGVPGEEFTKVKAKNDEDAPKNGAAAAAAAAPKNSSGTAKNGAATSPKTSGSTAKNDESASAAPKSNTSTANSGASAASKNSGGTAKNDDSTSAVPKSDTSTAKNAAPQDGVARTSAAPEVVASTSAAPEVPGEKRDGDAAPDAMDAELRRLEAAAGTSHAAPEDDTAAGTSAAPEVVASSNTAAASNEPGEKRDGDAAPGAMDAELGRLEDAAGTSHAAPTDGAVPDNTGAAAAAGKKKKKKKKRGPPPAERGARAGRPAAPVAKKKRDHPQPNEIKEELLDEGDQDKQTHENFDKKLKSCRKGYLYCLICHIEKDETRLPKDTEEVKKHCRVAHKDEGIKCKKHGCLVRARTKHDIGLHKSVCHKM